MMATNDVIADSSFLFVLYNTAARQHESVARATDQIRGQLIVFNVVLTEVAFLFRRLGGVPATTQFITGFVSSNPRLEYVSTLELIRARDLMNAYSEANLDFVDCCLAAAAETRNISQIATLDRRDFRIIRPRHRDYFELLP